MFTLYSADYINAPGNCSYPHKTEVVDAADLAAAVSRDYVCAEYMNHYGGFRGNMSHYEEVTICQKQ